MLIRQTPQSSFSRRTPGQRYSINFLVPSQRYQLTLEAWCLLMCACVLQDFFSLALIAALLWLVASAYFELEKIR